VKKTIKDMSENQLELDPDITTDTEVVIDTEEELIKQCEEMWKDMEELSLLIMQVKCLTAELDHWNKRTPE
ncbi:hypothetical protein A6R68_21877, partial [Neotoma lepida]